MANLEPRTNELKGTETEKNLLAAFAGESQARNKYTYFASKAKKDGYVQISYRFFEYNGVILSKGDWSYGAEKEKKRNCWAIRWTYRGN